jgi:hypothetical protein
MNVGVLQWHCARNIPENGGCHVAVTESENRRADKLTPEVN